MITVSATNGKRTKHIGCYDDEATAARVRENIAYFAGVGWRLWW